MASPSQANSAPHPGLSQEHGDEGGVVIQSTPVLSVNSQAAAPEFTLASNNTSSIHPSTVTQKET